MKRFAPKLIRFFVNLFIVHDFTYLLGMLLVRFSRKLRKKYYKPSNQVEMLVVNNCMGNIKMKLDVNSYMGGSIYWCGFHHINEMLFLRSFLKADMVFVDIGANQGEFSLFAASVLTQGKVIAFEPVTKQYDYFVSNIQLNSFPNIELNHYGLSNENGSLPVYTSSNTTLHSGIHEGISTLYQSGDRNEFQEQIELKVFDVEYEGKFSNLDFIKIDIEGAELVALKGMKNHLEKFKPAILIEMNDDTFQAAGYSIQEMAEFLYSFEYKAYKIHRGKLISQQESFPDWGNYIFKTT